MSWSSRLGNWSGRFSPFARSPTAEQGGSQVSDGDFSYITSEDLKRGDYDDPAHPPRDTDLLVLKHRKNVFPVHFAAYSIDRGELTVGHVREQAAKKIGTSDFRRIKLLYKGKNLKDDARACRAEGLKVGAEIMCVAGDALPESLESSDSDSDGLGVDSGEAEGDKPKRKRNRTRNKKKKGKKYTESFGQTSLPVPSAEPSRAPSPKVPVTHSEKLDALDDKLNEMKPLCLDFLARPPTDKAKREFEHKKLGETILAQILLKLDAVESDEPEIRARRKALVKESQRVLSSLDEAMQ